MRDVRSLTHRPHGLAIDRQANGHTCAFAQPARDIDVPSMQRDQPLHDRNAKSRTIVAEIVSRPRLKEWPADLSEAVGADADTSIFDCDQNAGGLDTRGDS